MNESTPGSRVQSSSRHTDASLFGPGCVSSRRIVNKNSVEKRDTGGVGDELEAHKDILPISTNELGKGLTGWMPDVSCNHSSPFFEGRGRCFTDATLYGRCGIKGLTVTLWIMHTVWKEGGVVARLVLVAGH